jgi:hypothetical protein
MRCTLMKYTPIKMHAHEMHACEMHTHEMYAREVHAYEMHAYEIYAHEMHAHIHDVLGGGLGDLLGYERPYFYSDEDFDRRCAESLMPDLIKQLILMQTVVVRKLGAMTGLTEGSLAPSL